MHLVRVTAIDVWVINVPLVTTFASHVGSKGETTRTVVRVRTDDGNVGWGETMHGQPTADLVRRISGQFKGTDPRAFADVQRTCAMVPFFYGYLGYCAIAAIEMAFLDLAGKAAGMPLHLLLGGAVRQRIPITALLTAGDAPDAERADLPGALAAVAGEQVGAGGFEALKFKGSADAEFDVAVMRALRAALPATKLRVDPNGAWSVAQSLWAVRALAELDLEYLEDPCWGLEGTARVRAEASMPLCTNMWVVQPDHLAPAVRANAVDIVHADVHKWGGVRPTMDLYAVCQAFGLGVNFHSGGELGISTACTLQVAAAFGQLDYAIDAMYYLAADDVLTERITLRDGALELPGGNGLGVDVDVERVEHFAARHARDGDHTP